MDTMSDCPICFESLIDKTVGSPDNCDHKFCLPCLEKWSKHGNFCPVDRQIFKKIISGDEVIQIKYKRRKKPLALYDVSVCCDICKDSKEENDTVILCDSCDLAFHFDCLEPPLKSIPHGSWYCPDCQEVARKLKAQKTQKGGNASTHSKQSSSVLNQHLTLPTTQTGIPLKKVNGVNSSVDQSTNIKFTKHKHKHVKQSCLSKKDYNEKNLPCTKSVNAPLNFTKTPPGEFEDFFSIYDNDVILTNRKPLSRGDLCLQLLGHVRKNLETQPPENTSKRLAATVERRKVIQNHIKDTIGSSTDDSSSSSGVYSAAEKNSLENAPLNDDNPFTDINKSVLSYQSSTFSLSKSNFTNELGLEDMKGKDTLLEDLNESATSKSSSVCGNLAISPNTNSPDCVTEGLNKIDFLHASEKAGCKASSTSTKINNSISKKLNVQISTASESFSVSDEPDNLSTNCKSLGIEEKSSNKRTAEESFRTNSITDFGHLRKKSRTCFTESRKKRLAATNARKKMFQAIKSFNYGSSSESSDSGAKPSLNINNHHLFVDIEKILSRQNSTFSTNESAANPLDELSSSKSGSKIVTLNSDSESIKEKNTAMEDLNKSISSISSSVCGNPKTSTFVKVSDCGVEGVNRIESLSVFEKPGWKTFNASTEINNSIKELSNDQIPMTAKSFSALEKSTVDKPPQLIQESLNFIKNPGHEIPPELLLEPLNMKNHGNEIPPIIRETKIEKDPLVVEELNHVENGSSSEIISLFERNIPITAQTTTEKHSSMIMTNNEETHSHMKGCQNAENSENDGLSQEKDNFPETEITAVENILDDFHIRQVHYAFKAKMNLPAELQKIERETWLSHKSKSSSKYKYKSRKEAEIRISSSSHHIVAGNAELYNFLKNTQLGNDKFTHSKKDLAECNSIFNPFSQSVSGSRSKTLFKVTEYALQPSDKQVCFNKIPKDVLRSFVGPNCLKHLDIREDGSLFLNWSKSNSL